MLPLCFVLLLSLGKLQSSLLFRLSLASADAHSEQGFGEGHQNVVAIPKISNNGVCG